MVRMKNLTSLQALALAGVAVALTTGCSSTQSAANDSNAEGYRFAGPPGWTPITDNRYLGMFPTEWNPVSYESRILAVPADGDASASVGASASVDAGSDASVTAHASADGQQFSTDLQPGDTFVEAAGSDGEGQVRRVILYSPFSGATSR